MSKRRRLDAGPRVTLNLGQSDMYIDELQQKARLLNKKLSVDGLPKFPPVGGRCSLAVLIHIPIISVFMNI